jgi:molecular chaperone GrpE
MEVVRIMSTPGGTPDSSVSQAAEQTTDGKSEIDTLRAELDAARAETQDLNDKFLRARAEVENIRRRAEIDVATAHKYGLERFASEVIAVRDSLDLASTMELANNAEAIQKMHEGLELTLKLLDGVFEKFGITLIDPKGEKFDPNRHQAISTVESVETPANHIVNVVQKGYMLRDRMLRPAMVVVSKGPKNTGES